MSMFLNADEPIHPARSVLAERREFEQWAEGEPISLLLNDNEDYVSYEAQIAWKAWQARAAVRAIPGTKEDATNYFTGPGSAYERANEARTKRLNKLADLAGIEKRKLP